MKRIFKYELGISNEITLKMPKYAQIIAFQAQRDVPCIWAIVNTDNELVARYFVIHGTGHEIKFLDDKTYMGTCQTHNGNLVWHLFELVT